MREKITVTYEIPAPPKGWVYDRVRKAKERDELYYVDGIWNRWPGGEETEGVYPIAIRNQQWRPATEADIGREDARFFDHRDHPYCTGKLLHMGSGNFVALSDGKSGQFYKKDHASNWEHCEVPVT